MENNEIKILLEGLYQKYHGDYLALDPLEIVRQYDNPKDQEISGMIAAALAIGRTEMIKKAIEEILLRMETVPSRFVREFDPVRDRSKFEGFRYRFYRDKDIGLLIWWMHQMVWSVGSIEKFFLKEYKPEDRDIGPSLSRFVRAIFKLDVRPIYITLPERGSGIRHFLADPQDGSGCKRLNLFLRWMVRDDGLDLGIWKSIEPSQLVIPLDTHIIRMGRCLGLTQRRSPDWKMAVDITESLRSLDPKDPVKYDIALCRMGKLHACPDVPDSVSCALCPANRLCMRVRASFHRS